MRGLIIICMCVTALAAPQGYLYNQQQNELSNRLPDFHSNFQAGPTTINQENHGFLQQTETSGSLQQTAAHNTQQFSAAPNLASLQPPSQPDFAPHNKQQHYPLTSYFGEQHQSCCQQQTQPYETQGLVTKDIYVHVAPEDTQNNEYQKRPLPPPPPRKHYRIVFIKAPSHNTNNAAVRIQQAPTEEKTIIYVLTKKTDPLELQNAFQQIQPRQPSKPEVYFIKYKTQAEAQHAQRTIQAQYDKLGGTSQISDEGIAPVTSVIGSLDDTPQKPAFEFANGFSHTSSSLSSTLSSSGAQTSAAKYLPPIIKL